MNSKKNYEKTLAEIEKDYFKPKRQGFLTEFGRGQLDLVKLFKKNR